jgi:hypothetical protein
MKFLVFFALSILGLQNILASWGSRPLSDKETLFHLSKLILTAFNSGHAAKYDFRFYETTRLFSNLKSHLCSLREKNESQLLDLLLEMVFTAEEQFEKSFATFATESYSKKLETSTRGIVKKTRKLQESLLEYDPASIFYPIPLLRLLNKKLENKEKLSMQQILDSSPEHLWTPVDWCVYYWLQFSRHLPITSQALFDIFENMGHDPDFLTLRCQTRLLETFSKRSMDYFDHLSSYGNLMATYFLFSYMRLLLQIACDVASPDETEPYALSEYVKNLWKEFLESNVIDFEFIDSSEVKSWFHDGKFIPEVKESTPNHIKINAITISQISNIEEKQKEVIFFMIREVPLPGSNLPVPCLDFYVSSKINNRKFYKKIMKIMIDRLTQSNLLYTKESILVLKKGMLI